MFFTIYMYSFNSSLQVWFRLKGFNKLILGSKWVDEKLVDEFLGFGLFRSSSFFAFFVFFECSLYSKGCVCWSSSWLLAWIRWIYDWSKFLNFLKVLELHSSRTLKFGRMILINNLQLFFEYSSVRRIWIWSRICKCSSKACSAILEEFRPLKNWYRVS